MENDTGAQPGVQPGPEPGPQPGSGGVGRRALIGGALGVAAAGFVSYEAGARSAATDDAAAAATDASAVRVEPTGELLADDVQSALTAVYDRTSALARLQDLQVAHELVDDFPLRPGSGAVGSLDWASEVSGPGASVTAAPSEGGVVQLSTGTSARGRAGIHLGLDQHRAAPLFTMEWRAKIDQLATATQSFSLAFGAVASVSSDPGAQGVGPGMWIAYDPERTGPNWWCRCTNSEGLTEVDSKRKANTGFRRFTITSDGTGLIRFSLDDELVASISENVAVDGDRYGQGIEIAKTNGATPALASVDWFYLRRELPR